MISGASSTDPIHVASVVPLLPVWRLDRTFDYRVPDELEASLRVGSVVRVPFGNRKVRGVVVGLTSKTSDRPLETVAKLVYDAPLAPAPLDQLVDWIARRYGVARGVAFARVVPPRVRVKVHETRPLSGSRGDRSSLARYENADGLLDALANGRTGVWSLRALPGEDRGAVIADLIDAAAAAESGAAVIAVPEVRYGSQVLDRVTLSRPELARVDSAQAEIERTRSWLALAGGHGVGGGGRAAVLAPAPRLRLIVLDEEHHNSFKEDRSPRYDARRVALERARLQGAVCVLMSATPPLETAYRVLRGEWAEVVPNRAARRAARPVVEVVEPDPARALTGELHTRMRDALRRGERVALLVPSKGYARALWCASCKRSLRCPVCEAGLFYDRQVAGGPRVRCARCGLVERAPDTCPTCGAAEWRYLGAGSERLAEQVRKAFPRATVGRVDPSTLAADDTSDVAPDIYVTTWIGTKAVLRPDASLVAVLDGDSLIRRPDFRAAESAYQAFAEMSEWAGPAAAGGRLVIQASDPGHHALQAVVRADYGYFAERELEQRRQLAYPPFAELVKVTVSGSEAAPTVAEAAERARRLGARVLGPIAARRQGSEALEILIKCPDALPVAEALRDLLAQAEPGSLRVDVDPS